MFRKYRSNGWGSAPGFVGCLGVVGLVAINTACDLEMDSGDSTTTSETTDSTTSSTTSDTWTSSTTESTTLPNTTTSQETNSTSTDSSGSKDESTVTTSVTDTTVTTTSTETASETTTSDSTLTETPTTTSTETSTWTDSTTSDDSSSTTSSTGECVPDLGTGKRGLTWGHWLHKSEFGIDLVGCHAPPVAASTCGSCDPYSGDTPCERALPLLCLHPFGASRPPYGVSGNDMGLPKEGYYGWSGGIIELSRPVVGTSLATRADADRVCAEQFGEGFRLAEHHDGYYIVGMNETNYFWESWPTPERLAQGGWNIWSYGEVTGTSRFWVHVDDQSANCWSN